MAPDRMAAADRALLDNPAARVVWDWLDGKNPDLDLTPDSVLERDQGFDSIGWLHFALKVEERFGVRWTDGAIARVTTVRDLLREIVQLTAAGETVARSVLEAPEAHLGAGQKRWIEPLGPSEARFANALFRMNRRLVRSVFRLRVEGADLVPRTQVTMAPTHGSFLDAFVVAAALDRECLARTFWAADTNIAFANPLNRRISRLGQAFPFDAEQGFVAGMASAAAVLQRGYNLIWFPEGWRSRSTALQEFKRGIGMLLKHCPVPVMPVAIRGAHEAYPPGRILPRPRPVAVGFGKPLDPARLASEGEGATAEDRIAAALRQHTGDLYEEVGRRVPL